MAKPQKIAKWGNSLAVRIPREAAEQAGFHEGDDIAINAAGGKLTVVRRKRKYRIEDFLDQMTPDRQPELIDWGPPVGKEVW
jgi:antitoxin MazE